MEVLYGQRFLTLIKIYITVSSEHQSLVIQKLLFNDITWKKICILDSKIGFKKYINMQIILHLFCNTINLYVPNCITLRRWTWLGINRNKSKFSISVQTAGSTELRTNVFAVRSFAPNSADNEKCEQAKLCEQREQRTVQIVRIVLTGTVRTVHTVQTVRTANSVNSSFFRNRRTGRTDGACQTVVV